MRKKFRTRLSSVFLAMLMILSLLTISALAEENSYQEWSQSDALPASGSYRLMSDVTINEAPNITGSLVLDLNGRTVTLDGVGLNILKSGKLTLEDSAENGKIEITNSGRSGDRIVVSGTFTLSGGTIENQKTNVAAVLVNTTGSCTISGGTISNTAAGAKALMVSSGASVSVTGGTISSSVSGQTISINSAVFSMSGGYVKSACTAIYPMNSSTVTITGGTFTDMSGNKKDVSQYIASGYQQNEEGSVVPATEYYVDPANGLDSNNGTGADTALKTFAKAMELVPENRTILVMGDLTHTIRNISKPVTIKGVGW